MELLSAVRPVILGLVLLLATFLNKGVSAEQNGRWEPVPPCQKFVQATKATSFISKYKCGWLNWWRCERTSYRVGYFQIRQEFCCSGTVERDGSCYIFISDDLTPTPPSGQWETKPWCVRYVPTTQAVSYTSRYRCGWNNWWRCSKTSYRQGYRQLRQEYCCNGAVERDGICQLFTLNDGITDQSTPYPATPEPQTTTTTTESVACGIPKFDAVPQIVGGRPARMGEFPWMASLVSTRHFCGGTIINDRWILTAAHCVVSGRSFNVIVGEHNRSMMDDNEVSMEVNNVIYHESYSAITKANDIAMVKLRHPITFNDYVMPACLPSATKQVSGNITVTIAGWGVTAPGPRNAANGPAVVLQKAQMKTADLSFCQNAYGTRYVTDTSVCVTDGQGDTERSGCFGDSGGPLLLREEGVSYVIGATSIGSQNGCAVGGPVVYTNIAKYINWIDTVMAAYP